MSATCKAPDGKALGAGIGDGFGSKTPVKVSITGGVFASDNPDADIAADKVCGASVGTFAAPRAVIANPDSVTFAAYPVTVCEKKAYAPTLAPKGGFTYDGNQLSATDFDLGAAGLLPTRDELAAAASFESKEASASEYGPEMPKNAGTYDVRATLARIVRVEDGAPVCYVASGPADVQVEIAPRQLSATVSADDPSATREYDGTTAFSGVKLDLTGVLSGDVVSAMADGSVVDPAVGTKDFTATAVHLNGPSATNYALVPGDVTGKASIAPRQISVSSASVASKTYDGTKDAKVEEVLFDNLVDGESLAMGADFTATGAFESSAAGKGKRVLVEVSLVPESPVCKNYVLAEGGSSVETTGDIVQSGASLDLSVGGAGGGQAPSFLYGETMSFTVTPQAAHSLAFRSAAEPTLQLFVVGADGSEAPLCEPVEGVAEGKPTTVYYDTGKKLLPVGESVVRVRVSGMANLQEAFEDVRVLVKPKGVELSWSGLSDRVYGDGAQVSAQLVGALPTDDVRVEVSGGSETEAGGPYAATALLAGEDAFFYAIDGSAVAEYSIAKAPAFVVNASVDMKRLQPGDKASVDVAALLPEAARGASFEVASFTEEGLVSAEIDAAGILTLTSDAPASAQRDEVEVRLSGMANCEDSKVVVTVAYVDKPVAKISGATAADGLVYNGSPQVGFAGKPVASFDGGTYEGDFKLSYEGVGETSYGPSADAPTRAGDYVATLSVPGDEPSCAGSI